MLEKDKTLIMFYKFYGLEKNTYLEGSYNAGKKTS